jgi:hypothetical protein
MRSLEAWLLYCCVPAACLAAALINLARARPPRRKPDKPVAEPTTQEVR